MNATILAWANFDQALMLHTFKQTPHDNRVCPQASGDDLRIGPGRSFVGNDAQDLDGGCHAGVCSHNITLVVMFYMVKADQRSAAATWAASCPMATRSLRVASSRLLNNRRPSKRSAGTGSLPASDPGGVGCEAIPCRHQPDMPGGSSLTESARAQGRIVPPLSDTRAARMAADGRAAFSSH